MRQRDWQEGEQKENKKQVRLEESTHTHTYKDRFSGAHLSITNGIHDAV